MKKLTDLERFDIKEIIRSSLLQNRRRKQIVDLVLDYIKMNNCNRVSENYIIKLYNETKKSLFEIDDSSMEDKRKKYVENMARLAKKAEAMLDFNAATRCYVHIARAYGVLDQESESNIILNLMPVSK